MTRGMIDGRPVPPVFIRGPLAGSIVAAFVSKRLQSVAMGDVRVRYTPRRNDPRTTIR
jgi:hypothetical protein